MGNNLISYEYFSRKFFYFITAIYKRYKFIQESFIFFHLIYNICANMFNKLSLAYEFEINMTTICFFLQLIIIELKKQLLMCINYKYLAIKQCVL